MVNAIQQSQLTENKKDDHYNPPQEPTSFHHQNSNSPTNGFHHPPAQSIKSVSSFVTSSSVSLEIASNASARNQPAVIVANAVCTSRRRIADDEDEDSEYSRTSRHTLRTQSTMSDEHTNDGCASELVVTSSTSTSLATSASSQLPLMTTTENNSNHVTINHNHNGIDEDDADVDDDEEHESSSRNHNPDNTHLALNNEVVAGSSLQVNEINCTVTISDDSNSADNIPLQGESANDGSRSDLVPSSATTINNNKRCLSNKIEHSSKNGSVPLVDRNCESFVNNVQKVNNDVLVPQDEVDDEDDDVIEITPIENSQADKWSPFNSNASLTDRPPVIIGGPAVAERINHQNQNNHQVESQLKKKSTIRMGNNIKYNNHLDGDVKNMDNGDDDGGVDKFTGCSSNQSFTKATDPCSSSSSTVLVYTKKINSNQSNSSSSSLSIESSGDSDELHHQDTRRVEPLKINLSRDPIKTVIKLQSHHHLHLSDDVKNSSGPHSPKKLIIKPIARPDVISHSSLATTSSTQLMSSVTNCNAAASTAGDHLTVSKITKKPIIKEFSTMLVCEDHEIVPRLTIKSNNEGEGAHIVPKLTIRSSTSSAASSSSSSSSSDSSSKKDDHLIVNNNSGTSHILEDGVKVTIKHLAEPPLPKLTIKTTGDNIDGTFIVNTKEPASPISKLNIKPIIKPDSPVHHPKVTIKPIIKPTDDEDHHPTVPKLTFKSKRSDSPVPKIVVRVPKDSATTTNASAAFNDDNECSVVEEAIPKLTIRQVKSTITEDEQIVIPKVTIKPIVNPNDANADAETLITPKITIKPIPKPLDITQPLEIVTPVHRIEQSQLSQGSPRIILKINKSKETEDLTETLKSTQQTQHFEYDLKRPRSRNDPSSSHEVIESKKIRLNSNVIEINDDDDDGVDNVSMRSAKQQRKEKLVPQQRPTIQTSLESKNQLKLILKRMQLDNKAKAELEATHSVTITGLPKIENKLDEKRAPTRQSRRMAAKIVTTVSVPEETNLNDGPSNANMPSYLQNDSNDAEVSSLRAVPNLILLNEGSSSDCIIVEDGGSNPLEDSSDLKISNKEHPKKEQEASVDRDSGVDVCNSGKQVEADAYEGQDYDTQMTPVKRPRGRPRKDPLMSRSIKKQVPEETEPKRKFAGVTMASTETAQNDVLLKYDGIVESNGNETISEPDVIMVEDTDVTNDATIVPVDVEKILNDESIEKKEEKKRAPRIIPDDDDESPTFNPLNRSITPRRGRGRGLRGRGSRRGNKARVLLGQKLLVNSQANASILETPERYPNGVLFSTPDGKERRKLLFKDTPLSSTSATLQLFEEDTRMSADLITPARNPELYQNEESQSSMLSCTSATVESNSQKRRCKMEVADPEGRAEYTVDMIAEYDWPPPKGCCPSRNRDTFMIQEQVCEYLGVKSFKRRYPDLQRRMVEMEERNYLQERGQVSEKMCDMGLTAVLASDVLDIMVTDFCEKYEEYKRFRQDKHFRDMASRQKTLRQEIADKSVHARENAIDAAVSWNIQFNRSRKEDRRECLDLQNLVINLPEDRRKKMSRPNPPPSHYPIALVPGQFQEYYRRYTPAELLCYPVNTVLSNPVQLRERLRELYTRGESSDSDTDTDSDSSSGSSNSDSSSSDTADSDSSSSQSDDEDLPPNDTGRCRVCDRKQNSNQDGRPEIYIKCSSCRRRAHPSCIEISPRMATRLREYKWQCSECKQCIKCYRETDEDKMLFCDQCDRGYHIYCIGLTQVPEGRWHCSICSICTSCGTRNPEGHHHVATSRKATIDPSAAAKLWTHEYREGKVREHVATLCVPCAARPKNHVP